MRKLTLMSTCLVTERGPNAVVAKPGVRNMYGCLPCYRCGSGYRAAYVHLTRYGRAKVIRCDDCGHEQKAVFGDGYQS
jgi:hypothetical protein